jgi:hypothetical protein
MKSFRNRKCSFPHRDRRQWVFMFFVTTHTLALAAIILTAIQKGTVSPELFVFLITTVELIKTALNIIEKIK